LRITVQLINVSDDSHLWSETFNDHMDDIFRIQDDIAEAVVKQLKITLLGNMAKTSIVKPEAYTLYLEAKYFRQQHNHESCLKAEKLIYKSISIDPGYALSWSLLAGLVLDSFDSYMHIPEKERVGQLNIAVQKINELEPDSSRALFLQSYLYLFQREFDLAKNNMKKALSLSSGDFQSLISAAIVANSLGKISDAIEFINRGLNLYPLE